MLCEYCQDKEASVHLTQVVEGSVKKLHLCEECARKSGFDIEGPISSIQDAFLGLGAGTEKEESGTAASKNACPACGLTFAEFKRKGRLGCAQCYDAFRSDLIPLLQSMQHSSKHVGKVPENVESHMNQKGRIECLQKRLDKAIASENFEEAANLRDEIAELRNNDQQV